MTAAALAVMMLLADSQPAATPPTPRGMARARLYLGPSAGTQTTNSGSGGVIGYQGFTELSPYTASFWGIEILGWRIGAGALPIFTGDLGLRWSPLPYAFLRPFVTLNAGLSLLIILPVPSVALGLGVALPIGEAFSIDLCFRGRYALNYFDTTQSVNIASIELGLGF